MVFGERERDAAGPRDGLYIIRKTGTRLMNPAGGVGQQESPCSISYLELSSSTK